MRLTLTYEEFQTLWRLRRGLEPLRTDCRIDRIDGIDLPELERGAMEAWFARQLREAPVEMLATTDIAATVRLDIMSDGSGTVALPDGVVRVVAVEMSGWARGATLATDSSLRQAQLNPYCRGGTNAPVAVADNRRLRLYTPAQGGTLTRLEVIAEPEGDRYTFDSSLLELIPKPSYIS